MRALATDLWVVERPLRLAVGDIGARMTVVRLHDGGLFLHSPVRFDNELRRAIDALGPVRAVVAPSKVHHLFVKDYRVAYPDAAAFGPPGLAEKQPELRLTDVLGDTPHPLWRADLDQHLFRGAPYINEVVFLHRASRTLVLTDLAFNTPADATRARLFLWVVGARGRFGPHRLVRTMLRDRAAARTSVARLLEWDFDRVIVSHGDVLETGGRARLQAGFGFL